MKNIKPYEVFEFHGQLNIPFKEPEYKGKSVHEDIEDALIDLVVMKPEQYYSNTNPEGEISKERSTANKNIMEDEDDTTRNELVYELV